MHDANLHTAGGYISGEVKVAISLRLISGGTALDLGILFDVDSHHCLILVYNILLKWIIKIDIGNIHADSYLSDIGDMTKASNGFSHRSNGLLKGFIGEIDGWLVRIVKPILLRDGIKSITLLYS